PPAAAQGSAAARRRGRRRGRGAHVHPADVIAQVAGRLAAKQADRVMIHTAGGVGYEIVVPLGVMERLPAVGETVTLATELVVREDGWSLYGFQDDAGRRFFQRLIGVSGVGPKIAIALMSALGVERGARAVKERNIALPASVSGIGKKTAERLALELADKLGQFEEAKGAEAARCTRLRAGAETARRNGGCVSATASRRDGRPGRGERGRGGGGARPRVAARRRRRCTRWSGSATRPSRPTARCARRSR